jgi:VWFA-related protein
MSIKRYCIVAATLFGVSMGSAFAQQTAAPKVAPGKINLDVVVTASKGGPVGGLSETDFTVLDNKKPRSIASFAAVEGKEAAVQVVIVIDSVNTPYTYLGYQRDQIVKYLRSNGGKLPYVTSIAVLTDTSFQMYEEGAGKDGNALADKLEHTEIGLRIDTRSQGFWGAADRMTLSLNALRSLAIVEGKKPGRKLVLWVSPGWPLLSGPEVELEGNEADEVYHNAIAFSSGMRKAGVTLYSINSWGASESLSREDYYQAFLNGLKGPADAEWGNVSLQVLAAQSGGLVLSSSDVVQMMTQCVSDANQYYQITLDPAPDEKPNAYHQLQVKLSQGGLVARTRTGYYGRP